MTPKSSIFTSMPVYLLSILPNMTTDYVTPSQTPNAHPPLFRWRATSGSHSTIIAHLSPARFDHINLYGKYRFDLAENQNRQGLRPLRPL
ncbi:MAG: transposase [Cyanobacteria bacterium RU_5_0]|nr:transposase [Cyanobacteria bacterium RU_5_0]